MLGEAIGLLTMEKVSVPPGSEMELLVKQTGANGLLKVILPVTSE